MKALNFLFIISIALLGGCKAFIETEVKLSELLHSKTKEIGANLYLEVAACNSHEDSRKESSSVIEAKEAIPKIFTGAEYKECFRKEFDSYAHFSLPMILDKDQDGKMASDDALSISSNKNLLLLVNIPPAIKTKIDNLKKKSFATPSFDPVVNITVVNDIGEEYEFEVFSVYINDTPYLNDVLISKPNSSFNVKLSNVSIDYAMKNGSTAALLHSK